MAYRCPYCKNRIEGEPQPKCPSCGRMMSVPKMREPNPRIARQRIIETIWREAEQKKAELHGTALPRTFKNPKFYFGIILILVVIGVALINKTDIAVGNRASPELRTFRNVEVLATALGRYYFHTGTYPTVQQELGALVRNPGVQDVPDWNGPYISHLPPDFWGTPFIYEPPVEEGVLPTLFSCGPDRLPNTPDDLKPDLASFDPGTEWTNGWLRAEMRLPGVTVLKTPLDGIP